MKPPADVFDALVRCRADGRACVLATVVRTAGSTPRKNAARMLVVAESGEPIGTIGGGRFEKEVVDACLALLAEGPRAQPKILRYQLTHDLAMCCGGEMEVFVEPMVPEAPLIVFGGGHVARAVVPLARSVGFQPIVVDEAPDDAPNDVATSERFPDAARIVDSWDPRDWRDVPLDARSYAIIVTRDHAIDQKLVEALIDRDLAYLGMIGSRRKVEMFHKRLEAKGIDRARLEKLRAPVGLDIGAETPEEIAVAIVGELIQTRAARRKR